ncbi:DNA-binding WRKY [Corchorus olitorius]|uniref:DNA-binding WRKY n=1 Tax=Corchorus olitorius TaxID=93759 RepID=A0A1R3H3B8_9ROSI|nr:DNA-binding WRKY [Corchorus olitorius]
MDKGWGLALDSDPGANFFPAKTNPVGPFFRLKPPQQQRDNMFQFPDNNKTTAVNVKKESSTSLGEASDHVNIGLHLLTANAGSDQSTVDDGVSSDMEDKRAKNELAQLQVELQRMNAENQKLRDMLSHIQEGKSEEKKQDVIVPRQFLDLGPSGTAETDEMSHSSSEERTQSGSPRNNLEIVKTKNENNSQFDQETSSFRDGKRIGREESPESEGWGPNKVQKLNPSPKPIDQSNNEATMRKARVSVRARSEAPMVQRCAEDRTILITTYEGNHNHPLPPAAMAMASTTSAAANMLLSGSMPSADGIMNPNLLARAILPCSSSMATISASAPFPTVTLDLTHSPNPLQFQRSPAQFQVPNFPGQPQNLPQVFGQALYNQSKFSGLQLSQDVGSSQLGHQVPHQQPQQQQPTFADTLSAATAAITADPSFTAALAAAITSIIGGAHPNSSSNTSNNNNSNANTTSTSRQ